MRPTALYSHYERALKLSAYRSGWGCIFGLWPGLSVVRQWTIDGTTSTAQQRQVSVIGQWLSQSFQPYRNRWEAPSSILFDRHGHIGRNYPLRCSQGRWSIHPPWLLPNMVKGVSWPGGALTAMPYKVSRQQGFGGLRWRISVACTTLLRYLSDFSAVRSMIEAILGLCEGQWKAFGGMLVRRQNSGLPWQRSEWVFSKAYRALST